MADEEKKSLMEMATAARPMDPQQVYNLIDSAFNRKLAPRIAAMETKLDALVTQVRKLAESLETKTTAKGK